MKLSKVHLAILALFFANVFWGASFPIYKWSLGNLEPFTFGFFRFFIAALLILPFTKGKLTIHKQDYLTLVVASLAGVTLAVTFWFVGLTLSSSINAPIIESTAPLITLIFASFFLHERLHKKTVFGTVLSFVGVLFIIFHPQLETNSTKAILGNICFLLATLSGIIHTLFVKKLSAKYNFIAITFWTFLIGAIAMMPLALYATYMHGLFPGLQLKGIIGLGYATIFTSIFSYSLFAYGMKYIAANETGIYNYIHPIIAVVIAVPLLGEKVTVAYLIGALLVFMGLYIVELKVPTHHFHRLKHI